MDNMQENGTEPAGQPSGSYGQKGGWKKWLLIYVVIAVVVYGIIYYFFMRDTGSSTPTIGY
ncbi:MAG: hypothetical protein AAB613_00290 [Patescibacteria group bacterium]